MNDARPDSRPRNPLSLRHRARTVLCIASLVVVSAFLGAAGCATPKPAREEAASSATYDSAAAARDTAFVAPTPPDTVRYPHYRKVAVGGAKGLKRLQKELGPDRFAIVLKVNRLDLDHVRDRDSLIVPDSTLRFFDISPFPRELPAHRDLKKLLLVSLRVQAFAAFDSGALARWGPTSSGRESLPTPDGLYHTNWKDKERVSTFNEEWELKWYINLQNFVGISLHQYELPGYPASHSCVRLHEDDAQWLYDWADQWKLDKDPRRILRHGTPVVIFGKYGYHRRAPWRRLNVDSTATDVPMEEIEKALAAWLPRDTATIVRPDSASVAVAPRPAAEPAVKGRR